MSFLRIYIAIIYLWFGLVASAQTVGIADLGFKKCLADSMPSVLDAQQDLILAQASTVTKLECPSYGIVSMAELTHFNALTELNITKNPIVSLPPLPNAAAMLKLNIGETSLAMLPDLSVLTKLQYLSIHRLALTQFPDVSKNINLVQLIAHTNSFETLPILNLPKLELLNVALTKIKSFPTLSNLKKLRQLDCFRNELTILPDLSALDSLKMLDASTNKLTQLPNLPKGIQTLYLDNNSFEKVPDLKSYPKVLKVRLFGNYLSFEDLLTLITIPNYNSVYEITPQKNLLVGRTVAAVEYDSLELDAQIDANVAGIVRKWYFNDNATTQTGRLFSIKSLRLSDKGHYYCVLSHPSMPSVTLRTDVFLVSLQPCVNISGVSTEVVGATCTKQGSLIVHLVDQPQKEYQYELKGQSSGKVYTSTQGQFNHLGESEYQLTVSNAKGCKYSLPTSIRVPKENCVQVVLTPNEDGIDDSYYFAQTGVAKIIDKWGNPIAQLSLPKLWDGHLNERKIPVGYYIVNINNGEEILKLSVIY